MNTLLTFRPVAIVAAYNEAGTIAAAVRELLAADVLAEVIVVDDGSTDETGTMATEAGARVIRLHGNSGKGSALAAGVAATDARVLLFSDADVLGLTPGLIRGLLRPVLAGEAVMMVGILGRSPIIDVLTQRVLFKLSGMRALRREVFESLNVVELQSFRVETALNYRAAHFGPTRTCILPGLTHVKKEAKLGFVRGFFGRLRMIAEIVHAHLVQEV